MVRGRTITIMLGTALGWETKLAETYMDFTIMQSIIETVVNEIKHVETNLH